MTSTFNSRRRHRRTKLFAGLVAVGLVVAACGGDDDDTAEPATTDESPAEVTATPTEAPDEATAEVTATPTEAPDEATAEPSTEATAEPTSDTGETGSGLLGELQEAGVVTVGLANEIPYGYEDEDGNILGEAPDVARAVLAELGIDMIEAQVVDFGALIPGLQAGQYDMIAAGMFITPERAEQIMFSDPDYCATYAFAVAEGNPLGVGGSFESVVDSGATLAVLAGAVDETYAADANVPGDQIELFSDVNAQYDALLAGRVDAIGGTSLTVLNQVGANDAAMDATDAFIPLDADGNEVLGCGGFGFIDQEFRDAFNDVLREKLEDGTVEEIVTGYGFAPEEVRAAADIRVEDLVGG